MTSNPDTRTHAVVVATTAVAAAVTWLIARALIGNPLTVSLNGGDEQTITIVSVLLIALVAGLLGWASFAVLRRRWTKGRQIWTAIAAVVLLLSLGGPISADTTTGTRVSLVMMHLVVGTALIAGFNRTADRA